MSRDGRRPRLSGLLTLLLPGLVAGCGGDGAESPAAATRLTVSTDTTVEGTIRVTVRGEAPRWSLEEIYTVAADATASGDFDDLADLALDRSGALWVADGGASQLRVFGSAGQLIRLIGRPGSGPGSFGALTSVAFLGNLVLALDPANGRVAELSPGGSWLSERPAPTVSGEWLDELELYPVGTAEVYQRSVEQSGGTTSHLWVRHGPDGILGVRPLAEPPDDAPPVAVTCDDPAGGSPRRFDFPDRPRWLQHPAPGGLLAVAWTEAYRVAFLNPAGDTVRTVERDVDPVPLEPAGWNAALRELRAFQTRNPGVRCDPEPSGPPATGSVIRSLRVDAAGRTWVEAATPEGRVWDVYGSRGWPLGTLPSFPRRNDETTYMNSELVAWVARDSLGVERVTVARILR